MLSLWPSLPFNIRHSRSTQPCILPGLLNQVPTLVGWVKGGNITSARWQVTLCDLMWHLSSHSGEACLQTAILHLLLLYCYSEKAGAFTVTINVHHQSRNFSVVNSCSENAPRQVNVSDFDQCWPSTANTGASMANVGCTAVRTQLHHQ